MKLHVGASRVRTRLMELMASGRYDLAVSLLRTLWPELSDRWVDIILNHLDETTVNGGNWTMPESWSYMLGEKP